MIKYGDFIDQLRKEIFLLMKNIQSQTVFVGLQDHLLVLFSGTIERSTSSAAPLRGGLSPAYGEINNKPVRQGVLDSCQGYDSLSMLTGAFEK